MNPSNTPSDVRVQVKVLVSGKVQGVGFRASTVRQASSYPHLSGYVKNLRDGRVEILIAGPKHEVDALLLWCEKGPSRAVVTQITVTPEPFSAELKGFQSIE